jgi:predicted Zn-dependent peptidase
MPHVETASLGLWVPSGTRHETADVHGISHMLEHMAFKGTKNRTAKRIAEEIESVGGELNAATSEETTAYFARVLKADVPLALELIADMLLNASFDESELEREREVILQEIAASRDSPEDIVFEQADAIAFEGQPLGRPILGTMASVKRIDRDRLTAHLSDQYAPEGMILSAAGAIDHGKLVRHAEALFGSLTRRTVAAAERARFVGGERLRHGRFEQAHVVVEFEGCSYCHESQLAAQVLAAILGGGASSRLFQKVREERGLCYSIECFSYGFSDIGLIGIHAATSHAAVEELLDLAAPELLDMIEQGPEPIEVERAKAQARSGLLMSLESSSARAHQLASHALAYGRPLSVAEMRDRVDMVTREGVREVARNAFRPSRLAFSCVSRRGRPDLAERFISRIQAPTQRTRRRGRV